MEDLKTEKLNRAKKRVEQIKGFYIHATIYTIINIFILVNIFIGNGYDGENFWQFSHFLTPFFWGIGLFFHAAKVFNFNPILNKDWEKRQIEKYMEEDRKISEKYTKK
ncbi:MULTISPECIES: 2TM domain-containing protein [Croceitalea]|uniref:2TM domain-containing protein n=1 Tax=Croceitalea vernalis TaxID=3075599 RepID=A0ABU3BIH1_9FLAO|nr:MULTISPECIES: 2TM domain-containing protein [unclassified Croceitalea]MDT0540146.1 2TM domain-containing protein [Croceitalea sp. P059]MDT0621965.1 2TM domain-containing protein [Croceitalea sp. P007]